MISDANTVAMSLDTFNLHHIWLRTSEQLGVLLRRAREGKDLYAAKDFARWVEASGLIRLFRDNPANAPHPVNAEHIERQIQDVIYECGMQWNRRRGDITPQQISELEKIHQKLDAIAGLLPHVEPPAQDAIPSSGLRVIQGGAS